MDICWIQVDKGNANIKGSSQQAMAMTPVPKAVTAAVPGNLSGNSGYFIQPGLHNILYIMSVSTQILVQADFLVHGSGVL